MSRLAGYGVDVGYPPSYHREMAPPALALACLCRQVEHGVGRPLTYLEIGFGQGLSLAIHAATNSGRFWGVDLNPAHVANAVALTRASGADATLLEAPLDAFAQRDDLPPFDVICLHGFWTWVSDTVRGQVVDLARRRLAPGGLLYVSYNTVPGWSPIVPLRDLVSLHARRAGGASATLDRIGPALDFAEAVRDAGAAYFAANPAAADTLARLRDRPAAYVAHEYLVSDWEPMPFARVAERMAGADLHFAAPARLLDHFDGLAVSESGRRLIAAQADPVLAETVRDYCTDARFRQDVFVKGRRSLPRPSYVEALRLLRLVLLVRPEEVPTRVAGPLGEIALPADLYPAIAAELAARHHAPKTIADILAARPALDPAAVVEALVLLAAMGCVAPAHDEAERAAVAGRAAALNAALLARAEHDAEAAWLASPVIGGGVAVDRCEQLFLGLARRGIADVPDAAWRRIAATAPGTPGGPAEMRRRHERFVAERLPILAALGVA